MKIAAWMEHMKAFHTADPELQTQNPHISRRSKHFFLGLGQLHPVLLNGKAVDLLARPLTTAASRVLSWQFPVSLKTSTRLN